MMRASMVPDAAIMPAMMAAFISLLPKDPLRGAFASAGSSAKTAVFGISGYFFAAFLASHGRHSNDG